MGEMAADGRRTDSDLTARLQREPQGFELLAAVRAIEATPGLKLRVRSPLKSGFAEGDVEAFEKEGDTATLVSGAFSLFGPGGPLPEPLARHAARKPHAADFFDVFGNRLFAIFLEIARLEAPATAGDPAETAQGRAIRALAGRAGAEPPTASVRALMGLAGLLNQRPISMHAVERAFATIFRTGAKGRSFIGGWAPFPDRERTPIRARGAGAQLGRSSLGRRAWLQDAGVELTLGPMDEEAFRSLLPGGARHRVAAELAAATLPTTCEARLRLVVEAKETPPARLSRARPPQLGWTSFLDPRARRRDGAARLRLRTMQAGG